MDIFTTTLNKTSSLTVEGKAYFLNIIIIAIFTDIFNCGQTIFYSIIRSYFKYWVSLKSDVELETFISFLIYSRIRRTGSFPPMIFLDGHLSTFRVLQVSHRLASISLVGNRSNGRLFPAVNFSYFRRLRVTTIRERSALYTHPISDRSAGNDGISLRFKRSTTRCYTWTRNDGTIIRFVAVYDNYYY